MGNCHSDNRLLTRSTTNTSTFLETCVLHADHKALEEHLENNQVQQSDLDRCLLRGLRLVQWEKKELSHVALALTLLLYAGAKWNCDVLLSEQKSPLHIICESPGDHHELLDLIIKSSRRTIINTRDIDGHTALLYAVKNANTNCLKCLIANGADVTIGHEACREPRARDMQSLNPITAAIWMLSDDAEHSYVIMSDIFDLLINTAVKNNKAHFRRCTDYALCASLASNVTCMMKLIRRGAPLDGFTNSCQFVWQLVASMGNVELLKCMFNSGIDKDTTAVYGFSILWHVVSSGNIDAVRYLLDLGVAIPTFIPEFAETQCEGCKENIMIIDDDCDQLYKNPCMRAITDNEIVKLLDEYKSKSYKSFCALRHAVKYGNVDVVSYLLSKYTYPINMEYILKDFGGSIFTLLTDPFLECTAQITKLLLDHGADPAKPICGSRSVNAIMRAIAYRDDVEIIAEYILNEGDNKFKSWTSNHGHISLLKASLLHKRHYVSVMLLIPECSPGVFRKIWLKAKPELMKEWNLYGNNVTSLKKKCRNVIRNYLSPRADMKIQKLPLPPCLMKFLRIPKLDNIVFEHYKPSTY